MTMMHEIQQFSPISPERWQNLKARLLAISGVDINDDKGIAEGHGIKVSYEYNPYAGVLSTQTLEKPWFLAETIIDQKIHEFVENTR